MRNLSLCFCPADELLESMVRGGEAVALARRLVIEAEVSRELQEVAANPYGMFGQGPRPFSVDWVIYRFKPPLPTPSNNPT